jgi:hypothetical protein
MAACRIHARVKLKTINLVFVIAETGDFNILCCLHIFVHMFGKYSEIFLKVALSTIKSTKYPLLFIMNTKERAKTGWL